MWLGCVVLDFSPERELALSLARSLVLRLVVVFFIYHETRKYNFIRLSHSHSLSVDWFGAHCNCSFSLSLSLPRCLSINSLSVTQNNVLYHLLSYYFACTMYCARQWLLSLSHQNERVHRNSLTNSKVKTNCCFSLLCVQKPTIQLEFEQQRKICVHCVRVCVCAFANVLLEQHTFSFASPSSSSFSFLLR